MKYYVLKCTIDCEGHQEENYGVLLVDNSGTRKYICDVTTDYDKISELVAKMNEYPVEPCHTEDIIEDFKYTLTEGGCT